MEVLPSFTAIFPSYTQFFFNVVYITEGFTEFYRSFSCLPGTNQRVQTDRQTDRRTDTQTVREREASTMDSIGLSAANGAGD